MDINKIIKRELPLGEDFNYRVLYNDSRGAVHKEDYERLLYHCLKTGIIEVEKYLVEEKISVEVFSDIADEKGKERHLFKEKLKGYYQERDHKIVPFIYLLRKIGPSYELNMERTEYADPILNFPVNIKVGHKFEETNAFSRLFCVDTKIAINSTNDDIETLISTLAIDELTGDRQRAVHLCLWGRRKPEAVHLWLRGLTPENSETILTAYSKETGSVKQLAFL